MISWLSKAQHGYFSEPKKSCLIVTTEVEDEARLVIGDLFVQTEWTSLSWGCYWRLHDCGQLCEEEGCNVGRLC